MSIDVMSWVFKHSDARGHDRLVLLALADEADDDGANCYPSLRRIATKARVAVGTASEAVKRLEAADVIAVVRPERTGRGHHNSYRIRVPWADEDERDAPNVKSSSPEPLTEETRDTDRTIQTRNARKRSVQTDTDPLTQVTTSPTPSGSNHQGPSDDFGGVDAVNAALDSYAALAVPPDNVRSLDAWRQTVRANADAHADRVRELLSTWVLSPGEAGQVLASLVAGESSPLLARAARRVPFDAAALIEETA